MKKLFCISVVLMFQLGFSQETAAVLSAKNAKDFLVDSKATPETVALFYNLIQLSKSKFTIGQQDAFNNYYFNIKGKSDIKKTTGQEPGILGVDFSFITDNNNTGQPDNWFFQQEQKTIADVKKAYDLGMIVTFCWHLREPYKGKDFYADNLDAHTKDNALKSILPGGENHEAYKKKLDKIAQVATQLIGADGKNIPIIFRPFHEFDGSWFWWGKNYCTPEELQKAYRFTVEYLRDVKGVHNFLYAFSPDNSYTDPDGYLSRYPGDKYVDLLGIDNYGDFDNKGEAGAITANNKLKMISDLAKKKNKIAAMTETGYQITYTKKPIDNFFSGLVYKAMTDQDVALAYVLFWGNSEDAYFVPQPNMPDTNDFLEFTKKPKAVLLNGLPKMYQLPK